MASEEAASPAIEEISNSRFVLRLLWVALRILICVYVGHRGAEFFYQGF